MRQRSPQDPLAVARVIDGYFAQLFPGQLPLSYYELALIVQQQARTDFATAAEAVLEARPEAEWLGKAVQIP